MAAVNYVARARAGAVRAVSSSKVLWRRVRSGVSSIPVLQVAAVSVAANAIMLCAVASLTFGIAAGGQRDKSPTLASARVVEMHALGPLNHGNVILAIGDRLKIVFFEQMEPAADQVPSGQSNVPNFVERVELTGEFTVQLDGNMFLPLLGPTAVAESSLQEVQARMRAAFQKTFNREVRVSLVIIEREPIYVVGPVTRPGTYKYSPGMIVLHAIALSGGLEGSGADVSQFLESMRESERQQKAAQKLKKLLARSAVLMAERTGQPPEVPARLTEIAGEAEAKALVAEMVSIRRLTAENRLVQVKVLDGTIESANRELKTLHARNTHIEGNIHNKAERASAVRSLHDRGSGSGHGLAQARSELAEVQERLQENIANISRTEQRMSQAGHEKAKLATEAQIEIERDLYASEAEIAQEELTLATSRHLVNAISKPFTLRGGKPDLSFLIVRRTIGGLKELTASESSALEPGDLIRIRG